MGKFILKQREIPLDDRWDVIVAGGGPAGCTSAISAAREGAKTLLIEESHGIPYRCLTPKGLTNVLIAGRSISCDRIIQGSIRVMPVCLAMGEAAGIAAAHASNMEAVDVHSVDVNNLRRRLKEEGAYLP